MAIHFYFFMKKLNQKMSVFIIDCRVENKVLDLANSIFVNVLSKMLQLFKTVLKFIGIIACLVRLRLKRGKNLLRPGVDFIIPFMFCAKLLRSALNFYAFKKLLKSWAQSIRAWGRAQMGLWNWPLAKNYNWMPSTGWLSNARRRSSNWILTCCSSY